MRKSVSAETFNSAFTNKRLTGIQNANALRHSTDSSRGKSFRFLFDLTHFVIAESPKSAKLSAIFSPFRSDTHIDSREGEIGNAGNPGGIIQEEAITH